MAFPTPGRVALGLPSPSPRVCTDGRTDGRTLTSQPKFFASIHYQISLAMELRWRALPAGFAIKCSTGGRLIASVVLFWDVTPFPPFRFPFLSPSIPFSFPYIFLPSLPPSLRPSFLPCLFSTNEVERDEYVPFERERFPFLWRHWWTFSAEWNSAFFHKLEWYEYKPFERGRRSTILEVPNRI